MKTREGRKSASIRLQVYKDSEYDRPNEKWRCGSRHGGQSCRLGPDHRGQCRAGFECVPTQKGDRWVCKRSAARGGPCEPGPGPNGECCRQLTPCVPVRSQRARRTLLGWALTVLALAVLMLALLDPLHSGFISPGELTMQHGALTGQCAQCHSAARQPSSNWLSNLVNTAMHPASGPRESQRCLSCHRLGEQPLQAHGLSPAQLQKIRQRIAKHNKPVQGAGFLSLLKTAGFTVPQTAAGELSCASCHQEHRGRQADLKNLTNQQCQACHSYTFSSLQDGHPPFERFGYKRRARLKFDHVSHFNKHFPKEKATRQCTDCHTADLTGKTMLSAGFESACSRCHLKEILGEGRAGERGIAILNLPGLDLETLSDAGIRIGQWPEDTEGELTPFMRLLLSADKDAAQALRLLKDAGVTDLMDLQDADKNQLKAVRTLVSSIKRLYMRLELRGQTEIKARLETALGQKLSVASLGALSASLPTQVISDARKLWFPDLLKEMAALDEKHDMQAAQAVTPAELDENVQSLITDIATQRDEAVAAGGWYVPQYEFAIRYRPSGHADRFLRGWLDLLTQLKRESLPPAAQQVFEKISDLKAPGLCIKCHSIDSETDGTLRINWLTKRPSPHRHTITHFNHSTHFSLLDDKGCQSCHAMDKQADFMKSFDGYDATAFVSGFHPIQKATCAKCHNSAMASDSCLNCHNYHVGDFDPTPLKPKPRNPDPLKPEPLKPEEAGNNTPS